jgi:hypothetical protein
MVACGVPKPAAFYNGDDNALYDTEQRHHQLHSVGDYTLGYGEADKEL